MGQALDKCHYFAEEPMKQVMMFAAIVVVTLAVHANPTQLSNCAPASREATTLSGFDNDAAGRSNCNVLRRVSKRSGSAADTGYGPGYNEH